MPNGSTTEPKSRLARAKDWSEFLSKLIPLIAGIIYVAGYIVTAQRLAEYDVSITQLLNAQYFTAGMAPGILICLICSVLYDAFSYDVTQSKGGKLSVIGLIVPGLFLLLLLVEVTGALLGRFWGKRFLGTDHWFDFYVMSLLRTVMGLAALWYVVAGFRSKAFSGGAQQFRRVGNVADFFQIPVMVLIIAISSLLFSYKKATSVYAQIPQAYGGGRPLTVRLYIERDKTPTDLIAADSASDKTLVHSIPVKLIFQTSDSLIVDSGSRRVWTLDATAVHAVMSNP